MALNGVASVILLFMVLSSCRTPGGDIPNQRLNNIQRGGLLKSVASCGIQVEVEQGCLEGELLDLVTEDGQYYSFKGVPYAEPPIGPLRFKAPRPAVAWDGVRDATQHGSVCPQFDFLTNKYIPGDEDCLFINVYSPNLRPKTLLPVIVFFHGGGFKCGSGNVDYYGPDLLISKNITVVTFNYRLDALGFLCLGNKDVPGNAGMKDQVAALKWIQNNIKSFGGDPDRVTIMGQSAGGVSVGLHLTSPMSKGLFQRAIVMSGSPYCDWALAFQPVRRAFGLGKLLGFETRDPDELLEFLQNVTVDKLVDTNPYVLASEEIPSNIFQLFQFVPVFEKRDGEDSFMTKKTFSQMKYKNEADVLFGYTNQETLLGIKVIATLLLENYSRYPVTFVPKKIVNNCAPHSLFNLSDKIRNYYFGNKSIDLNSMKEFVTFLNDATFVYDIIKYFVDLPVIGNAVRYLYQFSSMSSRNVYGMQGAEYGITGASHLDDLMYLFDPKIQKIILDKNSPEYELIEQVTTLFTNFAKYGNPTPDSSFNVKWPEFDIATMNYVNIGNNLKVRSVNDNKNIFFWKNLYYSVGIY